MSPIQLLAWLPPSTCGRVAKDADEVLSGWAATWGLPAPGQSQCEPLAAGRATPDDFIDLRAPPASDLKKALSQALFDFDGSGSAVVETVIRQIVETLALQLSQVFAPASTGAEAHGPLGHQGARVSLELLGLRCGFLLTCTQLRVSGKLAVPLPGPLPGVNLEQALAETPLSLIAELGRAEVNLDDLMQLAPGDVLLLKERLDTPLRVVVRGSAMDLSAHLGAFADPPQRAMRWLVS